MVVKKPGSVLTARVREVCQRCNSGWMSRLETAVQPILEDLWRPGSSSLVAPAAALTLATWATKTAWVREGVSDERVTATSEMRRRLAEEQIPPEFTEVWVARHVGRTNFGVYVGRVGVSHQDEAWDSTNTRQVLVCVMTFRGLWVLVRTIDGWGVPPMVPPIFQWRQFWPADVSVHWPAPFPVSDDDTQAIAMRYDWLRHPDAARFHRDPRGVQTIHRN